MLAQINHPSKNSIYPNLNPIFVQNSLVFLVINILTAGMYGAAASFSKQRSIKELKLIKKDYKKQISEQRAKWNELGELEKIEDTNDINNLKTRLKKLSSDLSSYDFKLRKANNGVTFTPFETVVKTIVFIGEWLTNIFTIGLYGVYQNYSLNHQIIHLEKKNGNILETEKQLRNNFNKLTNIINLAAEPIEINDSDQDEEFNENIKLENKHNNASTEIDSLKNTLNTKSLDNQKLRKTAEELQKENSHLKSKYDQSVSEFNNLKREKNQEVAQKSQEIFQKNQSINDLQHQLKENKLISKRVPELEKNLQEANKRLEEQQKLQSELGPIPPKYKPLDANGAVFENNANFDKAYKECFKNSRSASDAVTAAFKFVFSDLLEKAAKYGIIKINNAEDTGYSAGASAVYNCMALFFIKGGKIEKKAHCETVFHLAINNNVRMCPSEPKKVCSKKGENDFEVITIYTHRDDFTPEGLVTPLGVNAVEAKLTYNLLTPEEKEHLENLLLNRVIENKDLANTQKFMCKKVGDHLKTEAQLKRIELVQKTHDLIEAIANAMELKFRENILVQAWQDFPKDDKAEAFIKDEYKPLNADEQEKLNKIPDLVDISTKGEVIAWTLDKNILQANKSNDQFSHQTRFVNLISTAQERYQAVFKFMKNLMKMPENKDKEFEELSFENLGKSYYISHQMIDSVDGKGGPRCLFSNLLAVLMTRKSDLTTNNVFALKNAMAAYLDKLQEAKQKWDSLPENSKLRTKELQELAERATTFENAISQYHQNCTLKNYQAWLRGGFTVKPTPDIENLTPFEILLCAYTINVKFALLLFNSEGKISAKVSNDAEFSLWKENLFILGQIRKNVSC